MTPQARAKYLIKECGSTEKAIEYAIWVKDETIKDITRQHWQEVIDILKKQKESKCVQ